MQPAQLARIEIAEPANARTEPVGITAVQVANQVPTPADNITPVLRWVAAPRPSWEMPQIADVDYHQEIARAWELIDLYRDFEPAWPMLRDKAEELLRHIRDQCKAA